MSDNVVSRTIPQEGEIIVRLPRQPRGKADATTREAGRLVRQKPTEATLVGIT